MADSNKAVLVDEALANALGFKLAKDSHGVTVMKPLYKKGSSICQCDFKAEIKKNLRILDEQDAIHRYQWYGLPPGLDSELVERMIYYRGELMFFYMDSAESMFMLPYAGIESPNVYGRYLAGTPLIFGGSQTKTPDGKPKQFIPGMRREIVYSVPEDPKAILRLIDEGAVIVKDYTPQLPERIIPRADLMDGVLDMMAECFPLARTALISNCGVMGMRVPTPDAKDEVMQAADSVYKSALMGSPYVPMMGTTEFQELSGTSALRVEDYLLVLQSLDNFRLSLHGLSSGGLFQKKSHMLEGEQEMNESRAKAALEDGLNQRQRFCDMVNAIWGIGISVEISESALGDNGQQMPLPQMEGGESDGSSQDAG